VQKGKHVHSTTGAGRSSSTLPGTICNNGTTHSQQKKKIVASGASTPFASGMCASDVGDRNKQGSKGSDCRLHQPVEINTTTDDVGFMAYASRVA